MGVQDSNEQDGERWGKEHCKKQRKWGKELAFVEAQSLFTRD